MKLHRIEVTNLNSLYGAHAIDLDTDLGGASLFLILGPTGAGKSTLMDAVSLALFGTTPRLEKERSEVAIADQVMSRGEGTAQAVVVFSKLERGVRVRYRATWAARRARGRADGTLQATQRRLERLGPGGSIAVLADDSREKVYKPIFADVLEGFTAQDFQRSMLLAQGHFDAMLHASPEERASILERLTATAVYKELGSTAAQLRSLWAAKLETLGAVVKAVPFVPAEALEALRGRVAAGETSLQALEAHIGRLDGWRTWLVRSLRLAEAAAEALAGGSRVQADHERAAQDQAALAEHERCAEAFVLRERAQQVAGQAAALREQREAVERGLPGLTAALSEAEARAAGAEVGLARAEGALAALRGPVQGALTARHEVARAEHQNKESAGKLEFRKHAAEREAKLQGERDAALLTAEGVWTAAGAAFERLAGDESLAQALQGLERDALSLAKSVSVASRLGEEHARAGEQIRAREIRLAADREAFGATRVARLEPVQERVRVALDGLRVLTGEAEPATALRDLRVQQEQAVLRAQRVEAAGEALGGHAAARRKLAERRAELDGAQGALERALGQVQAAEADAALAEAHVVRALAVVAPLARIAAHGEDRLDLVEGAPCPLCGSLEHPFVSDPAQRAQADAVATELAQAREVEAFAQADRERARQHLAEVRERAAGSRVAAEGAQREHAVAEQDLGQARARAAQALATAGIEGDPEVVDGVDAPLRAVQAEFQELALQAAGLERADAAVREAREALAREERAIADLDGELARRASALEEAYAGLAADSKRFREAEGEVDGQRRALGTVLAAFGIRTEPAEAGLIAAQERARAWEQARSARDEAQRRKESATRDLAHGADTLARARAEAVEAEQACEVGSRDLTLARAALEAAEAALAAAWSAAVAHEAPQGVERPEGPGAMLAAQEARVVALRREADAARRAVAGATADLRAASARVEELGALWNQRRAEAAERTALVGAALAALGIEGGEDLERRRLGQGRLRELLAQREALRAARSRADAAIEAARRQAEQHTAERPGDLAEGAGLESLIAELQTARQERLAQGEALDVARADLQVAERDQAARAEAMRRLECVQERAQVWIDLHELIGKADGKHFQVFAQAMNLDRLLARANLHLARLSDRYRLRAVREASSGLPSLDFVVEDAWQVGSTRSLRTLSGGESFLVSLALALGLSDLRTSSMPVETLMLDEGFGTLDPHTLEIALSALEQLKTAGRQVGIISHVAGLQERVPARIVVEPVGEGRSRVRAELR